MDRPCPTAIVCPGPEPGLEYDSPITNYSSEYTDGPEFYGLGWPVFNPFDPGRPGWWAAVACAGLFECISFISQDDADACAQRLADICSLTPPRLPTNSPVECLADPSGCQETPTIYYNTAQTCQTTCPDGSLFYWTVPAGWFVADTQGLADRLAATLACQLANQRKVCMSALTSQPCKNSPWSNTLTASGGHTFIFSIIAGSLPPGIEMVQVSASSFRFQGTPTVPGHYSVTVQARALTGWVASRTYTISVLGILNDCPLADATVGDPYSVQLIADGGIPPYTFDIADGSLPDGLTMGSDGLISGTPTTEETQDFTIRVTDSTP